MKKAWLHFALCGVAVYVATAVTVFGGLMAQAWRRELRALKADLT